MSLRLAHAMVQVRQLDEAIAFYQHVLGLSLVDRHSYEGAELAYLRGDGGAELELLSERPWCFAAAPEAGRSHVAFTTGDLEAEHARIQRLGISCGAIGDYVANGRLQSHYFYIYDPEGNEIEILQATGRYKD